MDGQPSHAQLRAFHAVAREGGFTTAAARLRLTQPALTVQVRALESHYGVELFFRRGRRVELTPLGRELHGVTTRLFDVVGEADELLGAAGGLRRGVLRLGADGPYHVMPLLAAFRARHPGIRVHVTTGNSAELQRALLDYRVDVAILASLDRTPELFSIPLAAHPVVLFVPRRHPLARRRSVKLAELEGQPLIRREPGSTTQRAFDAALARAGITPREVLEIGSREALREAVAHGLGIGVVSQPELGHDHRLRAVRLAGAAIVTREHAVCLMQRRRGGVVQAFLALAKG